MQRRHFLQTGAALGTWSFASIQAAPELAHRKLVVILLRGAVDGLSVVAPYGDRNYAGNRPSLAIAPPGTQEGLVRLDSLFGMHPALARLTPYWEQGSLGFVHASGSPDPTRSHFDAQDYLESGTPGRKSTADGWMNRLLAVMPGPSAPTRAVNMGATPPRIFSGPASVASLGLGPKAMDSKAIDDPAMQAALAKLYAGDDALGRSYRDATEGRGEMRKSMQTGMAGGMTGARVDPTADAGAPSARSFAADAGRLGALIRNDRHTQLAFTSVGGWDTHVNQGAAKGQLANRLASLGEGIDALAKGLGDSLADTVIVVLSEFGRTVRQNGTNGSDHGRGNVIWLLGGPVAGGRMIGEWPGLETAALADGRDLAVVTDFRLVLRPIVQQHLGVNDAGLERVFPGLAVGTSPRVLRS